MKTVRLLITKLRVEIWYWVMRLRGEKAIEGWIEETDMIATNLWEKEFSTPDGLEWLANDLKENGHKWINRHVEMVAIWLQAHGQEVPEWAECTEW